MSNFRSSLPQQDGGAFLTDGGIETTLIFHRGLDLPLFAAYILLGTQPGTEHLREYYRPYLDISSRHGTGFILESPTWRANSDWARRLGHSDSELAGFNRDAIALMASLRDAAAASGAPVVISGCVGPRGDGYDPASIMTAVEARDYHRSQIEIFADTEADMVTAITMTNVPEALGVADAGAQSGVPVVISFTVETDGKLPTGETLGDAIMRVDDGAARAPAYYMINCAHPEHFVDALAGKPDWLGRIQGVRANASRKSHAELDESETLDEGDPADLGEQCGQLRELLPGLNILGGCCGTDHRHVEHMSRRSFGSGD